MAPRRKQPDKAVVAPAETMFQLDLRKHIQFRHPNIGLRNKENHSIDHERNGETLDHVHSEPEVIESEESE